MADQPYIKWWTSDFLTGVIDLTAEETGVYALLLTLMADRGGPLPDDAQWLARRCNTNTRAFNRSLNRLIDLGKIERRNDHLGNHRMMREITERDARSKQASKAAKERWAKWAAEHPPTLPFDTNSEKTAGNSQEKPPENGEKNKPKKNEKRRKSANPVKQTHETPSRPARASSKSESDPTPPQPEEPRDDAGPGRDEEKKDRLGDADLKQLFDAVCEAAGFNPIQPAHIDRAFGFVERWRADGIDFDEVIIPTIKAMIAKSPDPTRTLGRFDAAVRHENARRSAQPKGTTYRAPAEPILDHDGETDTMRAFRADLLEQVGPALYCALGNHLRLSEVEGPGGKRVLEVKDAGKGQAARLKDGGGGRMLTGLARRHGYDEAW